MAKIEPELATPPSTAVASNFKLVIGLVFAGTMLFVLLAVGLSVYNVGKPDDGIKSLIDKLVSLANIGFGAMVGLLGGKAIQ